MIRKSFLTVCILLASQCLSAQGIAGSWLGKLKAGPQELTITLRIEKNDEGRDVCFLGSPDQGVNSIPTQIAHLSADSVNVTIPALGAVYAAMSGSGSAIFGLFREPVELPFHDMFTWTSPLTK